ncbi:hypothetical protein [Acidibrevibacterium fodinaquatile]|uniref:hypothetical protein n=1 Tax=Acidibrevibacterium fodinaquatile TaxID=1969806 RepID=UPI0013B3A16E|nr:hypothetical protein [Acidibrevibacterium fodinaquatile]
MGIDSGNSLTALYHERWPMTVRKPDKIFVPTVSNHFFPFLFFLPSPALADGAEPAAPCPHKAGTAPRLGAEGKATTWASRNWVAEASSLDALGEC